MDNLQSYYKHWAYKNTAFLVLSLVVFIYFADSSFVQSLIQQAGDLKYFGAFLAGMFFVSTFTVAPAAVVLYNLADKMSIAEVSLLAGAGGVIGDYLIFHFLRNNLFMELQPLYQRLGGNRLSKLFITPYFAWMLPLLGAAIIASPLPDEAGVGLLGLSKLKSWQFILLSFALNAVGIAVVIILAKTT